MKILFITSSSINGGAQKHIREMFKSLTNLHHEVYLIAPDGWLVNELKDYGEKVSHLNLGIKNVAKLKILINKIQPDITNTFVLSGGVFGTLAWKKKKIGKLFVTVNNPVIYPGVSFIRKVLYPILYRWMSIYASAFLVKADKVRDEVAEIIRNKKYVISIKNGVDFTVFDKNREYSDIKVELGIPKSDIVITNVAALDVRKGQKYLIQAAVELKKNYPVHILLVGEGSEENKLRSQVDGVGARDYIHFLGRRDDINFILANTDIFVLPSIHEGLPNSLMEAMAMGLPCVATDVGGVRQLIDCDDKGIVIKPESSDDLITAIEKLLQNKTLIVNMGLEAYKKINNKYSQTVVVSELEEIYRKY